MGWPKVPPNNGENSAEPARKSRARSVPKTLIADLKDKVVTCRNPFLNFLMEFKKITPSIKMSGAVLAKIGGQIWRDMSDKQKSQFQIVEARRRRNKGGKRRRRKGRKHNMPLRR
ncbi:hypothetical protein TcasGA2_TC014970 [Tribolium castaneum]|uniref:HMG box domain-containing protein n=1 Tax=Tribolium castaneum TaxID=7070 RepID=D2A3M6_TRICA|nr:PREDICTED: uncharacterized protein LOC103312637 [Tribolium castaneum]EFA04906.1 hypothetical protein TcasGA2_TC014970 [Tribolium castaneum]|eukprot:XP_015836562.1 PREDICTED: uncharacterized protein LOC103312637 [Tribolium castaneum]